MIWDQIVRSTRWFIIVQNLSELLNLIFCDLLMSRYVSNCVPLAVVQYVDGRLSVVALYDVVRYGTRSRFVFLRNQLVQTSTIMFYRAQVYPMRQ